MLLRREARQTDAATNRRVMIKMVGHSEAATLKVQATPAARQRSETSDERASCFRPTKFKRRLRERKANKMKESEKPTGGRQPRGALAGALLVAAAVSLLLLGGSVSAGADQLHPRRADQHRAATKVSANNT